MLSQLPCLGRVVDFQSLCQLALRVAARTSRTAIRFRACSELSMTRTTRSASGYDLQHALDPPGPILARTPLARLHMAAAGQRLHFHEDLRDPVAHVLMLDSLRLAGQRPAKKTPALLRSTACWSHPCRRPDDGGRTDGHRPSLTSSMRATNAALPRGGIRQYFFR